MTKQPTYPTCPDCGAVNHGNATCRTCVATWPSQGIEQEFVDELLAAIGNQKPARPVGKAEVEAFMRRVDRG